MQVERAKVLSNTVKQKRKEKAGKWEVPLPKVQALLFFTIQSAACFHLALLQHCTCQMVVNFEIPYPCRYGLWQKMRCFVCSSPASAKRRAGSAWSPKSHLLDKVSLGSLLSMRGSSDHQVGHMCISVPNCLSLLAGVQQHLANSGTASHHLASVQGSV